MPALRIFYFFDSILKDSELFQASDVVEAVMHASRRSGDTRIEIWSGHRKVAEVGESPLARFERHSGR